MSVAPMHDRAADAMPLEPSAEEAPSRPWSPESPRPAVPETRRSRRRDGSRGSRGAAETRPLRGSSAWSDAVSADETVELHHYVSMLRRGWSVILVAGLLGIASAVGVTWLMPPQYEAEARVFVSLDSAVSVNDIGQGNVYSQEIVRSFATLATSSAVLAPVVAELGLPDTPAELADRVEASSQNETVILEILVSDTVAGRAADTADAITVSLAEVSDQITPATAEGDHPITLTTIQQAVVPEDPVTPRPVLYMALGLVAGSSLGVALVVLRSLVDTRIRTEEDLARISGSPVMGRIGRERRPRGRTLLADPETQAAMAEAVRSLRTNLQFLDVDHRARTLAITSSSPGEGKTTTVVNLAASMRHAGHRVLLVDADLRRPSVAEMLGIEGAVGLTDVLTGSAELGEAVQPWGPDDLDVLPAGTVPPNPTELLSSQAMRGLLDRMEEQYDTILVDTPPLLAVSDGAVVAGLGSGALLLVRMGHTHRHQLQRSQEVLERVSAPLLGVVASMASTSGHEAELYGRIPYPTRGADAW